MRIRRRLKHSVVMLLCAAMLASFCAMRGNTAQADEKPSRIIVSLGDSYASGEGNEPFFGQEITDIRERAKNKQAWEDWLAHRSKLAWSGQLYIDDDELGICKQVVRDETWYFVAASGATTENIVRTPYNSNPSKRIDKGEQKKTYDRDGFSGTYYLSGQLNIFYDNDGAFDRYDVDYVTLSIGGNDVGFVEILTLAAKNVLFSTELYDTLEKKLQHFYDPDSTHDRILETYLRIHNAAPNATIIVTGYPRLLYYFSNYTNLGHMGCPLFNVWECKYINEAVSLFNDRIEMIVNECHDLYGVDIVFCSVEEEFSGHEAYSIFSEPYIRRIEFGMNDQDLKESINTRTKELVSSYSMHPNQKGQVVYAKCINDVIRGVEARRNGSEENTLNVDPWLQVYYYFIEKRLYRSVSPEKFRDEDPHRFGMHDMDGDDVPELLIYNGNLSHDGAGCVVYAYKGNVVEIGEVSCSEPNGNEVGLSYFDDHWYPGLLFSDANTGLISTDYFMVDANGTVTRETVELYDWGEGRILERTSDDTLYSLVQEGEKTPLIMYTYEQIANMGMSLFNAQEEQGQYNDLWTAIDRSNVHRYLSMTYAKLRSEAGVLEQVMIAPDEFIFYNFIFTNLPGYMFSFDTDLSDAVDATDSFEIDGVEAERYIDFSTQCCGLSVQHLSQIGFVGSVNAKDIGATVYDFMDGAELCFAEAERGGWRYLFFCDEKGIITDDDACWIFPNDENTENSVSMPSAESSGAQPFGAESIVGEWKGKYWFDGSEHYFFVAFQPEATGYLLINKEDKNELYPVFEINRLQYTAVAANNDNTIFAGLAFSYAMDEKGNITIYFSGGERGVGCVYDKQDDSILLSSVFISSAYPDADNSNQILLSRAFKSQSVKVYYAYQVRTDGKTVTASELLENGMDPRSICLTLKADGTGCAQFGGDNTLTPITWTDSTITLVNQYDTISYSMRGDHLICMIDGDEIEYVPAEEMDSLLEKKQ